MGGMRAGSSGTQEMLLTDTGDAAVPVSRGAAVHRHRVSGHQDGWCR